MTTKEMVEKLIERTKTAISYIEYDYGSCSTICWVEHPEQYESKIRRLTSILSRIGILNTNNCCNQNYLVIVLR